MDSDFEIMYCQKGSFSVKIDTKEYVVKEGQILFVESSTPHEYYGGTGDNWITLLRVGSAFLGSELFREIAQKHYQTPIFRRKYGGGGCISQDFRALSSGKNA